VAAVGVVDWPGDDEPRPGTARRHEAKGVDQAGDALDRIDGTEVEDYRLASDLDGCEAPAASGGIAEGQDARWPAGERCAVLLEHPKRVARVHEALLGEAAGLAVIKTPSSCSRPQSGKPCSKAPAGSSSA